MNQSMLLNNSAIQHNPSDSMYLHNLHRLEQYNTDQYNQLKLYYDQRVTHLNTTIINTLQSISTDSLVHTLSGHTISTPFIQQRIIELVQTQLNGENEKLLHDCMNKLSVKSATVKSRDHELNELKQLYHTLQQQYNHIQTSHQHSQSQQLNDLTLQNTSNQQQIQQLTDSYNSLNSQYQLLQNNNATLLAELAAMKSQWNDTISESDDKLNTIINKYESQMRVYSDKLQSSEQSMKLLQSELNQSTISLSTEKTNNKYNCSSDICKQKMIDLMNEKQQLKLDHKSSSDRVHELMNKISKLKSNESKLVLQLDTQTNDKHILETKYHQIGEKLNELLKHDESAINQLLIKEQQKRQRVKDEYNEYKQKSRLLLHTHTTTIHEQEKKLVEWELKFQQIHQQSNQLQYKIDELNSSTTTQHNHKHQATQLIDTQQQRLHDTIDRMKQELYERETKYTNEKQLIQQESIKQHNTDELQINELKHQITLLHNQLESQSNHYINEQQIRLNDALTTQQRKYEDTIRLEYISLTQHQLILSQSIESEQKSTQQQLQQLRDTHGAEELHQSQQHNTSIESLKQQHTNQIELLNKQHSTVINELNDRLQHDLQPSLEQTRRELNALQVTYQTECNSHQATENKYDQLQHRYTELQQKHDESQQLHDSHNRQLTELTGENNELRNKIELLHRESNMLTAAQQNELQKLQRQHEQLQSTENSVTQLTSERDNLIQQMDYMKQCHDERIAMLNNTVNDKIILIDELKSLTQQKLMDAALAADQRYELLQNSTQQKLHDMQHDCDTSVQTMNDQVKKQINDAEHHLQSIQSSHEQQVDAINTQHTADLNALIDTNQQTINHLKQTHDQQLHESEQHNQQLQQSIHQLQLKLSLSEKSIQSLTHHHTLHYTKLNTQFIEQIHSLQQQLTEFRHDTQRSTHEMSQYTAEHITAVRIQCEHTLQVQLLQQKLKLHDQHQIELDTLKLQHTNQFDRVEQEYNHNLNSTREQHVSDITSLHAQHTNDTNELVRRHVGEVNELKQQVTEQVHTIDTLSHDIDRLNQQIIQLKQSAEQQYTEHAELVEYNQLHVNGLNHTISTQQSALTQLIAFLSSHLHIAVQLQTDAQHGDNNALSIIHAQLDEYIEQLTTTSTDLTVDIAQCKHQLQVQQQQYQLLHQQGQHTIESLENEIDHLQHDIDTMKEAQLLELELCKVGAIEPYKQLIDQQNQSIKSLQLEYSQTVKSMESIQLSRSKLMQNNEISVTDDNINSDLLYQQMVRDRQQEPNNVMSTTQNGLLSELDVNATSNQSMINGNVVNGINGIPLQKMN